MALDEQLRQLADRVPPPPAGDGPALFRRGLRRRRVRQSTVAALMIAVVGAGVLLLIEPPATPEITDVPPSPSPTATETDGGESKTPADVADPDRISCEPAGCEVWRRSLDGAGHVPFWIVGEPVILDEAAMVGLDLQTGDERWTVPVDDALRGRPGGPLDQRVGQIALAGTADHVALATVRGVQLVSQDGQTQWTQPLEAPEGAGIRWLYVTGDAVVVVHEAMAGIDGGPRSDAGEEVPALASVTVLDAADGRIRWSDANHSQVFVLPALADQEGILLARNTGDSNWSALALTTGEARYEVPAGPDRWPVHTGDTLALGDADGARTVALYDANDGRLRTELAGPALAVLSVEGRAVVLLAPDGEGAATREVVAVAADGSMAWRHAVEPADGEVCCATILDLGDGAVRVADGPGTTALVVDVATGEQHSEDPLATATDGLEMIQPFARHLALAPSIDEPDGLVLIDSSGRTLTLRGQAGFDPRTGEVPPETLLVVNPREVVAVRFP